jgi:hypothetical protein
LWKYTEDRLSKIEAILGKEEIEKVLGEVDEKMRNRLGDETWTAFREGRAIFSDEAVANGECQIVDVEKS